MGTNYYMITKKKDLAEKYFPYEYELTDNPYFSYKIHIGKASYGWKPLFQGHKYAYNSVDEMLKFFKEKAPDIELIDEYNDIYSLDEFKKSLVEHGKDTPKKMIVNEIAGTIECPIDHTEYMKRPQTRRFYGHYCDGYWSDEQGYNFTNGEFS